MKGNGFQYFLSVDIQLLDPESGFPGQSSVCTFGTGYDTDTQRRRSSCVNNFLENYVRIEPAAAAAVPLLLLCRRCCRPAMAKLLPLAATVLLLLLMLLLLLLLRACIVGHGSNIICYYVAAAAAGVYFGL